MQKESEKKPAAKPEKKSGFFKNFKFPSLKDKKKLQLAIAIVLIAIVLVIYFSTLNFGGAAGSPGETQILTAEEYRDKAQRELEAFLTGVKGAGKVKALVNFESSPERVIAYIVNESKNSNIGADGKLNENSQSSQSPVILNQNGSQIPLIIREIYPKVTGVVVAAEGANDTAVRLALLDAVRTYFHIDSSLVQVFLLGKN
ncbi:MAG: hypothetical protein LBL66_05480 [Clostridiales bacterium]|jgi:stage III sporulation protein AG|nr:hypothetical protein [Clostridiales bacterium]